MGNLNTLLQQAYKQPAEVGSATPVQPNQMTPWADWLTPLLLPRSQYGNRTTTWKPRSVEQFDFTHRPTDNEDKSSAQEEAQQQAVKRQQQEYYGFVPTPEFLSHEAWRNADRPTPQTGDPMPNLPSGMDPTWFNMMLKYLLDTT